MWIYHKMCGYLLPLDDWYTALAETSIGGTSYFILFHARGVWLILIAVFFNNHILPKNESSLVPALQLQYDLNLV